MSLYKTQLTKKIYISVFDSFEKKRSIILQLQPTKMAFFSTTNILSLRSSILINPRFLPIHNHHRNPPLCLSLPHKPTFNLSDKNPKTIVTAVASSHPTLSTEPSPRFPFSDSTKSITTLTILAGLVAKSLILKLSTAVVALSPQLQASLRISGPLFFASFGDNPAGHLNMPLTVVAAGLSKCLDI